MTRLKRGDKLVIATHNPGKVWEIGQLLEPFGVSCAAAGDLGVPEPEETGATFEENAQLKAAVSGFATGLPALADDSGIEVHDLDGAPGIYAARWAGPEKDFAVAMQRVQNELEEKGKADGPRRATFVCVLALMMPGENPVAFEGRVAGRVIWPPRGNNGFGYDPMFIPDGYDLTWGEMEPAQKYAMSHRAVAFEKFKAAILSNDG
ncbi:MAG: RdgB/HAM1 family non-canonical purine NTP pyrophosphatase [Chitinophagales bacterium]|nr:RdgB/HAM1 family non-canonical purine NTP pyrophosphatase [Hyphomicrobiales bacterium]